MINVFAWAIMALLIYTVLKAFESKMNNVPFEEGLGEDSKISQSEALLIACIAPLGTMFAIGAVLYLFLELKRNPFEIIVVAISKLIKEFIECAENVNSYCYEDEDED